MWERRKEGKQKSYAEVHDGDAVDQDTSLV